MDKLLFEIELKVSRYYKHTETHSCYAETHTVDIHVDSKVSAVTGVNILNKGRIQVLNTEELQTDARIPTVK